MKCLLVLFALMLLACGENSSPEGRMTKKINSVHQEIDSLKKQNMVILDSLRKISEDIQKLKEQTK